MLTFSQEQLLIALRQFHLVAFEWGGTFTEQEKGVIFLLHSALDNSSKEAFQLDCSELNYLFPNE